MGFMLIQTGLQSYEAKIRKSHLQDEEQNFL